jgi:PKD repeat protein
VVTTGDAGSSGLHASQTDSYVDGNEFYRSDVTVSNSTESPITATIFHAGDCFLQNSDEGFGWFDPASQGIFCSENANNSPPGRIVGFQPLTAGSHYTESFFDTVWSQITQAGTQFPDACDCATSEDNGAGLSWPVTVPANGSTTISFFSTFSPTGSIADAKITAAGAAGFSAVEGRSATGTVATFTDPDTGATAGEYSASINWGDGSTSAGTISGSGGSFTIAGTHTYAEEGSHTITVTITDVDNQANSATATTPATVTDAALHGTGVNVKSKPAFNGVVANFTDDDPAGTVSDYTASIDWGDGSKSSGTIAAGFKVNGSHTYKKSGTYKVTVTIRDAGGATVTVTSTVTILSSVVVRHGNARLTGVPGSCVLAGFRLQVRGRFISSVRFYVGNHRLRSRTVHRGNQYAAMVSLSPGKHRLTVKVTFRRSSHTRSRTFHRTVSGCPIRPPKFTG